MIKYKRTKEGLIGRIYNSQVSSCITRNHVPPSYTKQEFYDWCISQSTFHVLYDNWKRLDYQKKYSPSVDRIDDYVSYTMANIQLMTWGENMAKGHRDRKNGINVKASLSVTQYTKDGKKIATYCSLIEATRQTGIAFQNICYVIKGKRKTAGGYKWV